MPVRIFYLMNYFLYILKSNAFDKYYTGFSQNPHERLKYHNSIEKGFTSRYRPWNIVFIKGFNTAFEAREAELKIKKWKSKKMIKKLIQGEIEL